jgi:DNA-directed RNA polymerase specialized sigma24 family protein
LVSNVEYSVLNIIKIYRQWDYLYELRYKDEWARVILADLTTIQRLACLTVKERKIVDFYWKEGFTQGETAEALGICQQSISKYLFDICDKLAEAVEYWNWHDIALFGGEDKCAV